MHLSASQGNVTIYGQTSYLKGDGTFGGSLGTGVSLQLNRYLSYDGGITQYPDSTIRLAQGNNFQITTAKVSNIDQITFSVVGDTITELTTTGTSGAATFVDGVLNIPQYSGGSGTDNYVDGGSISGDTLTLTRTGGLGDVDITGLLELGTTSTTALAGNTAVGQVQSITTNGTSGAATLNNGVLNIPEYAGQAQATTWQAFYRKFTGSELRDAFNGSATDKITLIEVPADKMCILGIECTTFVDYSTGTTNYTFGTTQNLAIYPDTTNLYQFATSYSIEQNLLTTTSFPFGIRFKDTSTNYGSSGATGADIILARTNAVSSVNITGGDRDFIVTFTYRIIDLS